MSVLFSLGFKKIIGLFTGNNAMLAILVVLLAVIIIPNINDIKEKLGFDTKTSLTKELVQEKNKVETIGNVNKKLDKTIKDQDKAHKEEVKTIIKIIYKDKATDGNVSKIIADKDAEIKRIKDELKLKQDTNITDPSLINIEKAEQEKAISTVQIQALWGAYCNFEETKTCNTTTTG